VRAPREEIPTVERVLGGIEVEEYGLYFTPNRMVVAKTGFGKIPKWYVLLLAAAWFFFGLMGLFWFFLLSLPFLYIRSRRARKKLRELGKLPPENILMADEKNFELPYHDIIRVEMRKRRLLRDKITILTRRGKHEFHILKKREFEKYVDLIRSILPNKIYVS
jgi:hypothetical protein